MKAFFPTDTPRQQLQARLMGLAALFLFLYSVLLTLSPAVRFHSWNVEYRWIHWIGYGVWLLGFIILSRQVNKSLPTCDPYLLPIMALLSGWGVLTIWRLTNSLGIRQTIWLAICITVFWIGVKIPGILELLRRYKYLWLIGGLLLTLATVFIGTYPSGDGPNMWLGCCGMYFQPSEPLKLLLLVYLAAYLADNLPFLKYSLLKLLIPTIVLIGAAVFTLVIQRDLGTATIFLLLYFIVIYLVSAKRRIPWIGLISILLAAGLGYWVFNVIQYRVDSWLNPWADPSGRSYQIIQSLLGMAAGGIGGTGVGLGSPSVVPIAFSDFIYAAIAEETGLLGCAALILCFAFLLIRGFITALRAPNHYQRILAAGISVLIILQAILIMGGNSRLLPLTGVTLPFVSYGGSSLLTTFIAMLLLCLISDQAGEEPLAISTTRQYRISGLALLAGLAAVLLISGWWAVFRADDLLSRNDNPRRWVTDYYVKRGALLDRNNQAIAITGGEIGNYARQVLYTPLSLVTGYHNYTYGQTGLEASLDSYLRGVQGNASSQIWYYRMLHNQTPQGLDVRLSIDLDTQKAADQYLGDKKGAVILINARNGEILALASHPYLDANQVETTWDEIKDDPNAPMLNRALQASYPAGSSISPLLLTEALSQKKIPDEQYLENGLKNCAFSVLSTATWGTAISSGCPEAAEILGSQFTTDQLSTLYKNLGFTASPSIGLPAVESKSYNWESALTGDINGSNNISLSPLQMALAAGAISGQGVCPPAVLTLAVDTPQQGWVILPSGNSHTCFQADSATAVARMLSRNDFPIWETTNIVANEKGWVTWYVAGTTPSWNGTPLTIVVVLEEKDAVAAQSIGYQLLKSTLQP